MMKHHNSTKSRVRLSLYHIKAETSFIAEATQSGQSRKSAEAVAEQLAAPSVSPSHGYIPAIRE